jgi:hypothetical protein
LKGFDLSPADTLALIEEWNRTCQPPWTREELIEKIQEADRRPDLQPRGYMRRGRTGRRRRSRGGPGVYPEIDFDP